MLAPTLRQCTLEQGEILATCEPTIVSTILGSCVAVCLWDEQTRSGAVNHFALPKWTGQGEASAKYGDVAMRQLLIQFAALGVRLADVRAMVFGGASLYEGALVQAGSPNVEVALHALALENIPVVMKEVGGLQGRRIVFDSYAGKVTVQQV